MRTYLHLIIWAAILVGCRAHAPVTDVGIITHDCLGPGYIRYSYDATAAIPDARPGGIKIGPLRIPGSDGLDLEEVILQVDIVHPCPGDVELWLLYDSDNDGAENARVPLELHRARTDRCATRDPFACPCRLDGIYYFREDRAHTLPDEISLALLDALPRGGLFYLGVADTLAKDLGEVRGWAVYVRAGTLEPGYGQLFGFLHAGTEVGTDREVCMAMGR